MYAALAYMSSRKKCSSRQYAICRKALVDFNRSRSRESVLASIKKTHETIKSRLENDEDFRIRYIESKKCAGKAGNTDSAKRNLEDMLKSKKKKLEKEKEDAKKIAEVLEKEAICVYVNVNKDGDLFNRLSLQQIVDAIKLQTKIDVKASDIHMSEEDIKSLGRYVVGVYLHKSVVSSVTLNVMKNEEKKNM